METRTAFHLLLKSDESVNLGSKAAGRFPEVTCGLCSLLLFGLTETGCFPFEREELWRGLREAALSIEMAMLLKHNFSRLKNAYYEWFEEKRLNTDFGMASLNVSQPNVVP